MNGFTQILRFETIKHSRSFIYFTLVWIVIMTTFLSFFDGLKANADGLLQLLDSFPKEVLQIYGKDPSSITTLYGFFGNAITLYLFLASCIFVITLTINSLVGEINNKSIPFVLAKPISRNTIYWGKTLAIVTNAFITNIVLTLISIVLVNVLTNETDIDYAFFALIYFGIFTMQLFFIGLAQVFSLKFSSRATAIVSFTVVLSYMLNLISGFAKDADFLKYVSPNYYVNFDEIATTRNFNPSALIVLFLGIALIWLGSVIFRRKDIEI